MSPEEQFILSCLHSFITGGTLPKPKLLNWHAVYQIAHDNKIIAIIAAIIAKSPPSDADLKLFVDGARRARMRAALMIDEFQRIQRAFSRADVATIPFKGIALAQQVYPSPSMRYFDDLDLLIREDSSHSALEQLRMLGYEPHPKAPRPEWHHLPPHINRNRGTMVELHVDLVRRSRNGWNIEGIWDRSVDSQLDGVNTRLLSPTDSLITSALHARHNLYQRLSSILDIALLADAGTAVEDESGAFRDLIREAGATCALAYSIQTANRLFNLELAPIGECRRTSSWLSDVVGGWKTLAPKNPALKQGPLPRVIEVFLMDSLRDSLSLVGRLVVPPRSFIAPEKERFSLGRYASRFAQRAKQSFTQIKQVLRGG